MPAHIGFLDALKVSVATLGANISLSSEARKNRSKLATQRRQDRGQEKGLALGAEDPDHHFGDGLFSFSDMGLALARNRSVREKRCDAYSTYRVWLDARSPYLPIAQGAVTHADYVSKTEWDAYLAPDTWFDVAVRALFLTPDADFSLILIVRKSDVYQLKRIEGTNQHGTSIMWSLADSCLVPNVPQGPLVLADQ
ncbi:MAG: hypothetical protein ABSC06_22180 [Rhodopila sp.]|jgi:hypothetical protein